MSKDTIYRQDAMNAFDCSIGGVPVESVKYVSEYADKMMSRINALPSAKPERKTGKWNFIGNQMFECSECGTCYTQSQFYQMRVRISDTEFPKFCPNCGSYNGGGTGWIN